MKREQIPNVVVNGDSVHVNMSIGNGTVKKVENDSGDVTVNGNVEKVENDSGNVSITGDVEKATSDSGDLFAGKIVYGKCLETFESSKMKYCL